MSIGQSYAVAPSAAVAQAGRRRCEGPSLPTILAGDRETILGAVESDAPLASLFLSCYSAAVSLVARCAQCGEMVLEADLIGDEEECILRDHLLAVEEHDLDPTASATDHDGRELPALGP